jgi:Holliday junction resolvasome RuvABC ATP-dependent DNA helicase subunit
MSIEMDVTAKRNTKVTTSNKSALQYGLFDNIIGYDDIKKLFFLSFESQRPIHILLVGPPASAKTLFMLGCMKLERSYFTLGTHSTKSGMLDYLFEKRPRYLIIDEIEHMSIRDQTVLLSLMETGIIAETKHMKTRNTQVKTWVFATTNETNHLLTPLLSRFLVLHFKQYKFENFLDISIHMLGKEGIAKDIANEVATQVWHNMRSKDIRDCIKIANLAKSKDDVIWIVETLLRYNKTSNTSEKKQ